MLISDCEVFLVNSQLSVNEHLTEKLGGSLMETKAQSMIKEVKAIKEEKKITYIDIMEKMEENDPSSVVSLSTLRRIFRDGSELKASSFNYEEILMPVYKAVTMLGDKPKSTSEFDKEMDGYKAVIRVQNEELDRLIELKEHLDDRVNFLIEQIKIKDKTIAEQSDLIKKLMEKCL